MSEGESRLRARPVEACVDLINPSPNPNPKPNLRALTCGSSPLRRALKSELGVRGPSGCAATDEARCCSILPVSSARFASAALRVSSSSLRAIPSST